LDDTELGGEFVLSDASRRISASNLAYILFGKLSVAVLFSDQKQSPSVNGLSQVLRLVSKVQVRGLDADGAVARVQDEQPVGGAVINPVRRDMSANQSPAHSKGSVPARRISSPVPAPFGGRWSGRRVAWHEPSECFGLGESARTVGRHALIYISSRVISGEPMS
jgi:hypothetical protein